MSAHGDIQAFVLGRVGADLYPLQLNTPLEEVRTFERFVGGFAGNVATGLARLGVRTAIVSAVGDDGHGRFIRNFLAGEGVDVRWLGTHPTLRTALAFCEAWPPDRFPITFYRTPTCPDWELRRADLPLEAMAAAPLLYATGTGLARQPSRDATLAALEARRRAPGTRAGLPRDRRSAPIEEDRGDADGRVGAAIFDLDWREQLWEDRRAYAALARQAATLADVVIGGEREYAAAELEPADALAVGARLAVVKRGARGATVVDARGATHVPGLDVPVVNGLGAGDAFAAAFGAALLAGLDAVVAARRANAAGAIVAARLSCSTAMPYAPEVDALLAGGRVVDGAVVA